MKRHRPQTASAPLDTGEEEESDFQRFLAQAAAEDQAHGGQAWSTFTTPPPPNPFYTRPDGYYDRPHLDHIAESESLDSGGSITGSTTVPTADGGRKEANVLNSNDIGESRATHSRPSQTSRPSGRFGDNKYMESARDIEKQDHTARQVDMKTAMDSRAAGYVGASSGIDHRPHKSGHLNKKSSITQHISDYIRRKKSKKLHQMPVESGGMHR